MPTTRGLRIFNELGEDVTPLSLQDPSSAPKLTHSALFGFGEGSETGGSEWSPRTTQFTGLTDKRGGTVGGTGMVGRRSTMLSGFSQTYVVEDKDSELAAGIAPTHSGYHHSLFDDSDEVLDAGDLEKTVCCNLTETDTINLFEMPSTCVLEDDRTVPQIEARNAAYEVLCKSRIGNSRFAERGMQTINEPLKMKGTQASMADKAEKCDFAAVWDMFDEYLKLEPVDEEEEEDLLGDDTAGGGLGRPGSGADSSFSDPIPQSVMEDDDNDELPVPVSLELLPNAQEKTFIMEKALCMNTYQQRLAQFRRLPEPKPVKSVASVPTTSSIEAQSQSVMQVVAPHLLQLWVYRCPETVGRRVTCVRWNKANSDLMAVTYATLSIGDYPGLVCCWSPKNPDYPALIYRPPVGATCCDFSEANASLLAVGFHDGSLAMYSTSLKTPSPITDSFQSTDKHLGTMWDVQFVMKDQGVGEAKREVLMTISEDGRVLQWTTRQGLQNVPVLTMRRDPSFSTKKESRSRKSESFISRYAVGMHFSFCPSNTSQYLVATEAGLVHLCSMTHADQYVNTYVGHMAPVNKVHWSPFSQQVMLSCSTDWSFRVWHIEHKSAVLVVPSANKSAINDIQWSPICATQLALCTDQEVEVWDLAVSALDPLIVHPIVTRGATNTTLTFGDGGATLVVGDSNGGVTVYLLESLPEPQQDHVQQLEQVVQTQLTRLLSTEEHLLEEEEAAE